MPAQHAANMYKLSLVFLTSINQSQNIHCEAIVLEDMVTYMPLPSDDGLLLKILNLIGWGSYNTSFMMGGSGDMGTRWYIINYFFFYKDTLKNWFQLPGLEIKLNMKKKARGMHS